MLRLRRPLGGHVPVGRPVSRRDVPPSPWSAAGVVDGLEPLYGPLNRPCDGDPLVQTLPAILIDFPGSLRRKIREINGLTRESCRHSSETWPHPSGTLFPPQSHCEIIQHGRKNVLDSRFVHRLYRREVEYNDSWSRTSILPLDSMNMDHLRSLLT